MSFSLSFYYAEEIVPRSTWDFISLRRHFVAQVFSHERIIRQRH